MTAVLYIILALRLFLWFLEMLLLVYVISRMISMISGTSNPFFEFVFKITEPLLNPIRSVLGRIDALRGIPIDFSVLVAFLIIGLLQRLI